MKTKLLIKNKQLNNSKLIKNNHISKFIKVIAKNNEKVFCIIDSKIKIDLKHCKKKYNFFYSMWRKIKTFDGYKNLLKNHQG